MNAIDTVKASSSSGRNGSGMASVDQGSWWYNRGCFTLVGSELGLTHERRRPHRELRPTFRPAYQLSSPRFQTKGRRMWHGLVLRDATRQS